MTYGPPPHPRQVDALVPLSDHPGLVAAGVVLGLAVAGLALARRQPAALRAWWACLGFTLALTSPAALVVHRHVLGAWPTVDKTGSLLFYLDGVHRRLLLDPAGAVEDPALRLIGVHVGHLWVTQALDSLTPLPPFGAFGAQGLLYVALGWWSAALWAREHLADPRRWDLALLLGLPFGLGLHVFRDLNWFTIEKAGVFALALFAVCLHRAWGQGGWWIPATGLCWALGAFHNLYLALVGSLGAAVVLAVSRDRRVMAACLACAAAGLPLALVQLALLQGPGTLGDPDTFLRTRAALDTLHLASWPPTWNHLELWRAVNLPIVWLAVLGARRGDPRRWPLLAAGGACLVLALGPFLVEGVWNPVYMGLRLAVPGFWRVAKPETFFEGTYLALIALAALALPPALPRRVVAGLALVSVVGWLAVVRSHPAYPGFSEYLEQRLAPDWAERAGLVPPP